MAKRMMPSVMWTRGQKIANEDKVTIDYIDNNLRTVNASVLGTEAYGVTVGLDADQDFCECPYFPDHGYCKHIAAVIRVLQGEKRPIDNLFVEGDAYDEFENKFPSNYMKLSAEFEQRLADDPDAAAAVFPDKTEYNRLRSDPDSWDKFFADPIGEIVYDRERANSDRPDINALLDTLRRNIGRPTESSGKSFIDSLNLPKHEYFTPLDPQEEGMLHLEVTLSVSRYGNEWSAHYGNRFFVKLRISADDDKYYMVSDIETFLIDYQQEQNYQTGGKRQFELRHNRFSETEQDLLAVLINGIKGPRDMSFSNSNEIAKNVLLNPGDITRLQGTLEQLPNLNFVANNLATNYHQVQFQDFAPETGLLSATLTHATDGYDLKISRDFGLTMDSDAVIIRDNIFYQLTTDEYNIFKRIIDNYRAFNDYQGIHFTVLEQENLLNFLDYFRQVGVLDDQANIAKNPMRVHFNLDRDGQSIVLDMSYEYGDQVVESYNADQIAPEKRDLAKENQAQDYLKPLGFIHVGESWIKDFSDSETLYQFYVRELPNMRDNGQVDVSTELLDLIQSGETIDPTINVSESAGLLSVNFSFNGIDEDEVDGILTQLDSQKPYLQRADGSIVLLDDKLKKVNESLSRLRHEGQFKGGEMKINAAQALAVETALGDSAQFDEKFKQIVTDLAHPEDFDISEEKPVNAQLRPYQVTGIKWLEMLDSHGFGGILADEMGLGKTLQMITFLNNHLDDEAVNLIVSPASLTYNWQEEFAKFAPDVKTQVVDGTRDDRSRMIEHSDAQVFITSYNSARLDIESYVRREIKYLVLDEAQFVKNGGSKTHQSLRKLNPKNTFALSGTPIENRAEELWSIFALVMPGLLQSKKEFKKLEANEIAVRVKPFIMRREKKTVLKDLPPKVETNLTNEMTKEQKTVYLAQLKQMQVKVQGMSSDSFVRNKIEILAGLTRLRQICDTPALYMDDYKDTSGKLDQLEELMRQAQDNGRRVLIFSQFTTMLNIIEQKLRENGMDTFMLKGDTKPKDRLKMVEDFNAGEKDGFLISLKAGGTGLNLTGADLVILVDLWWNPAVEDQATARAHRIGQKNEVDVYRLITKGTIEEQIYKLQEKKRNFVDQVLSGTENKGSLTDDEIKLILGIE